MINKIFYSFTLTVLICFQTTNSQPINNKKNLVKKNFSFGEYWYLDLNHQESKEHLGTSDILINKEGIVNSDSLFFMEGTTVSFDLINNRLIKASDINSVVLLMDTIDALWYDNENISNSIFFWSCYFNNLTFFKNTNFNNSINFFGSVLNSCLFDSNNFNGYTNFGKVEFRNEVNILRTKFQFADFEYSHFLSSAYFDSCIFDTSSFNNVSFNKHISFSSIEFHNNANFEGTKFLDNCEFVKVNFYDTLNFYKTSFSNGVDLRRTNIDSIDVIILEDINYPIGKLYFYWEQFRGENKPKIQLNDYTSDKEDDYKRIERIYLNLRDNFKAFGDNHSADEVMFELAWQKDIIIENCWHNLYGYVLGYGYQPWRFIFIVIPLIFLFAVIWYFFYFGIIVFIVNPNFESDLVPSNISSVKLPFKTRYLFKKKVTYYDNSKIEPTISRMTKIWYVLHFSTSVLLGIRFKKEWIKAVPKNKIGSKSFMLMVTL